MSIAHNELPDDVDALKNLVLEKTARNAQLTTENERYQSQVVILQEQLNIALAKRFASRSEQLSPDQIRLFDEAESDVASTDDTQPGDTISVSSHRRKSGGRKPLPERLVRLDVVHELPADELRCDHDGQSLNEIGEVISEQLDIVPATVRVIRHVRKRYACACGRCIKTAPLPAQPIPKSMASPGLLAHVTVSKYQDGLPLYRTAIAPALLYLPPSMAVAGDDITAHWGGYPACDIGELDDWGGHVSAAAD